MVYTTQGLMSPADLADHEVLTDTGRNPECPGHLEEAAFGVPGDSTVYCSRAENCDEAGDWNPEVGASAPDANRSASQTGGVLA